MNISYTNKWNDFLIKGDNMFRYIIHNFKDLFDGENIKHFTIRNEGMYDIGSEEVMTNYGDDIHKGLSEWIHQEYIDGYLFQTSNWKPVRDKDVYVEMFLGYRRMFIYKNYYFQLGVDDYCELRDENNELCKYCKTDIDNSCHFFLLLYAIRNTDNTLKSFFSYDILPDNLVPIEYWRHK